MNYSTPFLDKAHQISSLLFNVVSPSYGPAGKNVMIITNTGRMLITNSGKTILKYITVDHPIARYVISSVQNFHERYGDGCVSFVVSLHSCLDGACKRIKDLKSQIQLSHSLVQIRNNFIYSSSFVSHFLQCAKKTSVNSKEEIKEEMKKIVQTLLEGKFGPIASYSLSLSVIQWIFAHSSSVNASGITEVVNKLIKYTPVVTVTNRNVDETDVWSGFVIQRSSVGAKLQKLSSFPVNFMVLDEDFGKDPKREENNVAIISVSSKSDFLSSISFETEKIRNFLKAMVKEEIQVLLCSGSVSENAIGCSVEHNIFIVPYVSQEDIERICKQAKKHPVYNYSPKVFESDHFREFHVGTFSEIREFVHAGKGYVHLTLSGDSDSHTLALNGPSEGLCEQYSEMIDRSLILIRSWLTWRPPNVLDLTDYPEFKGFTEYYKKKDTKNEEEKEKDKIEEEEEEYLYSVPGGGAIELELYFIFRKMEMETKQNSMLLSLAFHVLAKGMVSLPANLTLSFSFKNRSLFRELLNLQKLHEAGQYGQGFIVTSLSRKKFEMVEVPEILERSGDTLAEGIIHPMGLKFELLLNIVDTMIHILRIDGIYSSKKIIS